MHLVHLDGGVRALTARTGGPYTPHPSEFVEVTTYKRFVPVFQYKDPQGGRAKLSFFSIIRAKRPVSWGMAWNDSLPVRRALRYLLFATLG